MAKIKVFPDYCSTGLWDKETGANIDVPRYVSDELRIALKYWHDNWEFFITPGSCSPLYYLRWQDDGRTLTKRLNSYLVDEYEYIPSTYEADKFTTSAPVLLMESNE